MCNQICHLIQKLGKWKVGLVEGQLNHFILVFDKMVAIYPDFKWLGFQISDPFKSELFATQPIFDHSKSWLVQISDPDCIEIVVSLSLQPHITLVFRDLKTYRKIGSRLPANESRFRTKKKPESWTGRAVQKPGHYFRKAFRVQEIQVDT